MIAMKTLGGALVATAALAISAGSAMALELPDIHITLGEAFPLIAEGSSKGASFFETELGTKVTDEEVRVKLEVTALGSGGTGTVDLIGVKLGTAPCSTEGDKEGTVLISGEFHLVYIKKEPLEIGVLLSYTPFAAVCGKIKVKMSGSLLGHVNAKLNQEITELGVSFHCKAKAKGKQELSSYFNDAGEEVAKQLLLANFGLGNENGCKEIAEEVKGKANKMAEIVA